MYHLKYFENQDEHNDFMNQDVVLKPYVHMVGTESNINFEPKMPINYCTLVEQNPRYIKLEFTYPTDVDLTLTYHTMDIWGVPYYLTIPAGTKTFVGDDLSLPPPETLPNGGHLFIHNCSLAPATPSVYKYQLVNVFKVIRVNYYGVFFYKNDLTWAQFVKLGLSGGNFYIDANGDVKDKIGRTLKREEGVKLISIKATDRLIPLVSYVVM